MPSVAILGLLSVGIGIELAVTAFLILRFLESREPQVRWWAVAFPLYPAHVLLETLAFIWPAGLFLLWWRHLFFLLAAAAMARSFGPLPLPLSPLLAAVALVFSGLVLSGLLFSGSPGWAALPPSLLGGAWFLPARFWRPPADRADLARLSAAAPAADLGRCRRGAGRPLHHCLCAGCAAAQLGPGAGPGHRHRRGGNPQPLDQHSGGGGELAAPRDRVDGAAERLGVHQ